MSSNINALQRCEVRMRRGEAADKYKSPLCTEQQGNILALSSRSARGFFPPTKPANYNYHSRRNQ